MQTKSNDTSYLLKTPTHQIFNILYSSIKSGEKVYIFENNDLITFALTNDKSWSDKTISAIVIDDGTSDLMTTENTLYKNREESDWCADVFFTFKEYPCDDSTLYS